MAKPPRGRPGDRPVGLSKGQKKKYRDKNERLKRKQREETAEIDDDGRVISAKRQRQLAADELRQDDEPAHDWSTATTYGAPSSEQGCDLGFWKTPCAKFSRLVSCSEKPLVQAWSQENPFFRGFLGCVFFAS